MISVSSLISVSRQFLLSGVLIVAGCSSTPAATDWKPVVAAFRDCLDTYYAAKLKGPEADRVLERRRGEAGGRLVYELSARGVKVTDEEAGLGLRGLVPHVERYLHTRTDDVAFAQLEPGEAGEEARRRGTSAFPGSFLIVDGVEREERTVALAGRSLRYRLVTFSGLGCRPLAAYRDAELLRRQGNWSADRALYVSRVDTPGAPDRERLIAFLAAELLFGATADPAKRDAQALLALLEGPYPADAVDAIRACQTGAAGPLLRAALRAGGLDEPDDARLLAHLATLDDAGRRAIVKAAMQRGNLLEPPAAKP